MKKTIRSATSKLKLESQHIRLLTTTDLQQAAGGERPTSNSDTCACQSNKADGTCG